MGMAAKNTYRPRWPRLQPTGKKAAQGRGVAPSIPPSPHSVSLGLVGPGLVVVPSASFFDAPRSAEAIFAAAGRTTGSTIAPRGSERSLGMDAVCAGSDEGDLPVRSLWPYWRPSAMSLPYGLLCCVGEPLTRAFPDWQAPQKNLLPAASFGIEAHHWRQA